MNKAINNNYFIVLLFVLSFVIYGRTLHYQFVWDDERSHLTRHDDLMQGHLKAIWEKPYDGMYIPVTYSTWYLIKKSAYDERTHQLSPQPFHLANIIIHGLNSILVFLLLLLLFNNSMASFAGSLVFMLHPLQVESVAWVSEFRGLYSCFFSLLSLYTLLSFIKKNETLSFKTLLASKHFIVSTLLFIIALLAKPSSVTLPFFAAIITWCFYSRSFKPVFKALSAWLLFCIPVVLITSSSQANEVIPFISPFWVRPFLAGDALFFYFTKLIAPYPLVACYGKTPQLILESGWMYFSTGVIFSIFIFLFFNRNRYRHFFTFYCIAIITLLPVSGIISFYYQRYSIVADRYMYFVLVGAAILTAHIWQQSSEKKYVRYIIGLFICICTFFTHKQIPEWKDEFTMWDHAMQHYPHQWTAAYNRGVCYEKAGNYTEAISDYTIAISINPADKNSIVNRGNALAQLNRYDEAVANYSHAIALDGNDGSIYYDRSLTYFYMGKLKSCVQDLEKAYALKFPIDPHFKEAVKQAITRQMERKQLK